MKKATKAYIVISKAGEVIAEDYLVVAKGLIPKPKKKKR